MFERKIFFSLKIYGKLAGLSNKFEPSEFEGPRFDLYLCKMLISTFSWFFHTIFKDLTDQIWYPKCNKMHNFASFWKTIFWGGGQTLDPTTAFSLSRVGMYVYWWYKINYLTFETLWIYYKYISIVIYGLCLSNYCQRQIDCFCFYNYINIELSFFVQI